MSKKWWIVIAVVVVGVLGFAGYQYIGSRREAIAEAQAEMETAIVERGTLRVTLDATGAWPHKPRFRWPFCRCGLRDRGVRRGGAAGGDRATAGPTGHG